MRQARSCPRVARVSRRETACLCNAARAAHAGYDAPPFASTVAEQGLAGTAAEPATSPTTMTFEIGAAVAPVASRFTCGHCGKYRRL